MIMTVRTSAAARLLAIVALSSVCAVAAGQQPQPAGTGRAPQEGIKLHGHWVIEVRNSDGTLASRHEFDNSLTPTGKSLMATLFAKHKLDQWFVFLEDSQGNPPCVQLNGTTRSCSISEPSFSETPYQKANLTIALPLGPTGTPLGTVQLSGHAMVTNPAQTSFFDRVSTNMNTSSPSNGYTGTLTSHQIPRIAVTPGQILNVVVTFSFS